MANETFYEAMGKDFSKGAEFAFKLALDYIEKTDKNKRAIDNMRKQLQQAIQASITSNR